MTQLLSFFLKRLFSSCGGEELSEQRRGVKTTEVTIIRFVPDPEPATSTFTSGAAAVTWLGVPDDIDCFIEACVHLDNVSLGDFALWCSGNFACARIGEHRDHNASHLDSNYVIGDAVTFRDDDGSIYSPPPALIVPRNLAIAALQTWLIDQKHPGILRWD